PITGSAVETFGQRVDRSAPFVYDQKRHERETYGQKDAGHDQQNETDQHDDRHEDLGQNAGHPVTLERHEEIAELWLLPADRAYPCIRGAVENWRADQILI